MIEELILVDKNDKEIGTCEKVMAHLGNGKLHRAFSIFVFNSKGKMLMQKRAKNKMLWPGYWSNTCCSHPRKGEKIEDAVHRRLKEEMGFDCKLKEVFTFIYKVKFKDKGSEYEFDHIFVGIWDGKPKPNPEEVSDWRWADLKQIKEEVESDPEAFTPWFKIAFDRVVKAVKEI